MLKHESQPIKKRRSESKREGVIFPSKLRHFIVKMPHYLVTMAYVIVLTGMLNSLQLTQSRSVY